MTVIENLNLFNFLHHLVWIHLFYGLNKEKKIHCWMVFHCGSLSKIEPFPVLVLELKFEQQVEARTIMQFVLLMCILLPSSGFQHTGAEFWIMAISAVLHICSALWGKVLNFVQLSNGINKQERKLPG